jgi:hypothetical protein
VRRVVCATSVAVIGDVHGRVGLLAELLDRLGDMPIVSAGDVVDRGEDAKGCVELLLARGAVGVLGNHEQWVREWVCGEGFDRFALSGAMGGEATLRSYGVLGRSSREVMAEVERVPATHRAWFRSLVDLVDLEVRGRSYWVAHSAPEGNQLPAGAIDEQVLDFFAHAAERTRWSPYSPERVALAARPFVVGHMCRQEPFASAACIAIDTGSGTTHNDTLTAVILPELRFVSVRANR